MLCSIIVEQPAGDEIRTLVISRDVGGGGVAALLHPAEPRRLALLGTVAPSQRLVVCWSVGWLESSS